MFLIYNLDRLSSDGINCYIDKKESKVGSCKKYFDSLIKLHHDYKRRMLERWGLSGSPLLTLLTNIFYILPYFLFYLGLAFRYRGYNDDILTTARFVRYFEYFIINGFIVES